MQVTGTTSTSVGPFPGSWHAARMADLTPDLQVCLSWGSIFESVHSLQSLSVSCFHVILGLPGPCFPSTCRSKTVLTAPLEHIPHVHTSGAFSPSEWGPDPQCQAAQVAHWIWWWQYLEAWHSRSRECLIIALSFHCECWRFGCVDGHVLLAWSIALHTQELYTRPCVLKKRCREERTSSISLNFFQAVFTCVVVESSQPPAVCLLGSKRKLPPPACQVQLGLPSMVCQGLAVPLHLVHL